MAKSAIGLHPVSSELLVGLIALVLTAGLVWGAKNWSGFLGFLAVFTAIMMLRSVFRAVIFWLKGNARVYRLAEMAVAQGSLVPTYVGRDEECSSIVIVDEANKKLYLNGDVYAYADIKSVSTRHSTDVAYNAYQVWTEVTPWIEFHLRAGASPLKRVYFDSAAARDNFYARLCNSMNLS